MSGDSANEATGAVVSFLFPKERLIGLTQWSNISRELEEKNLIARPLRSNDFEAGYLDLLAQLTRVGQVSKTKFGERFDLLKQLNSVREQYMCVVIEDKQTEKVVGASTLHLEYKFIRECAVRGRLEDVAVLDSYRGKQIGELIVRIIVELAREIYQCYKLTLDCRDDLVRFYSKNNFEYASKMLCLRFKD